MTQDYASMVASIVAGKKWIMAGDASAGATGSVASLRAYGATDVYVIAGTTGVGRQPENTITRILGSTGFNMMEGIRAFQHDIENLPPEELALLDEWDPKREALVWSPFTTQQLFGRRTYGHRRPAWAALEDKTTVDALWDRAGVPRSPSSIAPVAEAWEAARALDRGLGTVWAVDNDLGWHGGNHGVYWVPADSDPADALAKLHGHRLVRVMPFLDGLPCSIHGFVTETGVASFRPMEMVIMRQGTSFVYGGMATAWDPDDDDREHMRSAARRTATQLSEEVGYRGGFSIDGVMTESGFLPTELNPRLSPGVKYQMLAIEGIIDWVLNSALVEEELPAFDVEQFERDVVTAADTHRFANLHSLSSTVTETHQSKPITWTGTTWAQNPEGDNPSELQFGPSSTGSIAKLALAEADLIKGPSVATQMAAAIDLADQLWETNIGPVTPAPQLR